MTRFKDVKSRFLCLFEETKIEPVMTPSTGSTTSIPPIPSKEQLVADKEAQRQLKANKEAQRQLKIKTSQEKASQINTLQQESEEFISLVARFNWNSKIHNYKEKGEGYQYHFPPNLIFKIPNNPKIQNLNNYFENPSLQNTLKPNLITPTTQVIQNLLTIKSFIGQDVPVKKMKETLGWDENFIDKVLKLCFVRIKPSKVLLPKTEKNILADKVNEEVTAMLQDIQDFNNSIEKLPTGDDYEYTFVSLNPETFSTLLSEKYPTLGKMVTHVINGNEVKGNEFVTLLSKIPTLLSVKPLTPKTLKRFKPEEFFDGLFKILDPDTKKELSTQAKSLKTVEDAKLLINKDLEIIHDFIMNPASKSFPPPTEIDDTGYTYDVGDISDFCNKFKSLKSFIDINIKNPEQPFEPDFTRSELFKTLKAFYKIIQHETNRTKVSKALKINDNILDKLVFVTFPSSKKVSNEIIRNTKALAAIQDQMKNHPEMVNTDLEETFGKRLFLNFTKFTGKDMSNTRDEFSVFSAHKFLNSFPFRKNVRRLENLNQTEKEVVKSMAMFKGVTPEEIFKDKQEFLNILDTFFNLEHGDDSNVFNRQGKISFLTNEKSIQFPKDDIIGRKKFLRLISTIRHLVKIRKDTFQIKIPTDEIKKIAGSDSATYGTMSTNTRKTSADSLRIFFKLMGVNVPLLGENLRDHLYKSLPPKLAKIWHEFWNDWATNSFETYLKR